MGVAKRSQESLSEVKSCQTEFQKKEMELSKQEMEVIPSRHIFTKVSPFGRTIPNWFSGTGNGIIQVGNGTICYHIQTSDQETALMFPH